MHVKCIFPFDVQLFRMQIRKVHWIILLEFNINAPQKRVKTPRKSEHLNPFYGCNSLLFGQLLLDTLHGRATHTCISMRTAVRIFCFPWKNIHLCRVPREKNKVMTSKGRLCSVPVPYIICKLQLKRCQCRILCDHATTRICIVPRNFSIFIFLCVGLQSFHEHHSEHVT